MANMYYARARAARDTLWGVMDGALPGRRIYETDVTCARARARRNEVLTRNEWDDLIISTTTSTYFVSLLSHRDKYLYDFLYGSVLARAVLSRRISARSRIYSRGGQR